MTWTMQPAPGTKSPQKQPDREARVEDAQILGAIVQSAEDAIVSTDLNGVILTWNPGAERLSGYSAAEVLGRPIFLAIPPDDLEEARDMIRRAQQGRSTLRRETVTIRKDGSRQFVSLSVSAIKTRMASPSESQELPATSPH